MSVSPGYFPFSIVLGSTCLQSCHSETAGSQVWAPPGQLSNLARPCLKMRNENTNDCGGTLVQRCWVQSLLLKLPFFWLLFLLKIICSIYSLLCFIFHNPFFLLFHQFFLIVYTLFLSTVLLYSLVTPLQHTFVVYQVIILLPRDPSVFFVCLICIIWNWVSYSSGSAQFGIASWSPTSFSFTVFMLY